jgi:hypothetical protein
LVSFLKLRCHYEELIKITPISISKLLTYDIVEKLNLNHLQINIINLFVPNKKSSNFVVVPDSLSHATTISLPYLNRVT